MTNQLESPFNPDGSVHKMRNRSELTGATDTISWHARFNSSPRIHMASSQEQQAVQPMYPDIPITMHGFERQMKDTAIAVTIPCDCIVEDVIPLYTGIHHSKDIDFFTPKLVVYRNNDTQHIGSIELNNYYRGHNEFGCLYKLTSAGRGLVPGTHLRKGTVLARSAGSDKEGIYTTSLNANYANMSMNGAIEDGFIVSEEFIKRATPTGMVKRDAETGKDRYFVGVYSRGKTFKPFPGYGESVRKDNLLMATRPYDDLFDSIYMLDDMVNEVDPCFDECVYLPHDAVCASVIGMTIFSSPPSTRLRRTPESMEQFLRFCEREQQNYNRRVIKSYRDIRKRDRRGKLTLEGNFEYNVTRSIATTPDEATRIRNSKSSSVRYTMKSRIIDEWYVEIDCVWHYPLGYGGKATDTSGCKGTFCEIRPASEMPRDKFGNVADIVQYGNAVFRRMNIGQEYERYANAACRDVTLDCQKMNENGDWQGAFKHAMGLIKILAPLQHDFYLTTKTTPEKQRAYVDMICKDIIRVVIPPDGNMGLDTMRQIRAYRRPNKDVVQYLNYTGVWTWTKDPILIAPKQVIILDKSAFGPMAVSVGRRQQHGLLATTNQRTKMDAPTTLKPPRSWGESEFRNLVAAIGGEALVYNVDISTNPDATRCVVDSMIGNDHPFQIYQHLNRTEVPPGRSRAALFPANILSCLGGKIETYRHVYDEPQS